MGNDYIIFLDEIGKIKARSENIIKDNSSKTRINCPNCGNEVDIISSKKCEYCDSLLVQNASDYVMSKKKIIGQRTLRNIKE